MLVGRTYSDAAFDTGWRGEGLDPEYAAVVQIDLVALIVNEYDPATAFFTDKLGFHPRRGLRIANQ